MPELDLGNVKGPQGKSAYQSALDAGYSGSEEAFNTAMAKAPDAVLYTAQSLTDEQQAQARRNINAAPGGFGLGGPAKWLTSNDDLNDIWQSGNYAWGHASVPKNAPNTGLLADIFLMHVWGYNSQGQYQEIVPITDGQTNNSANNNKLVRSRYGTAIRAWEWINPPMATADEYSSYRTIERYKGEPIFKGRLGDFEVWQHGSEADNTKWQSTGKSVMYKIAAGATKNIALNANRTFVVSCCDNVRRGVAIVQVEGQVVQSITPIVPLSSWVLEAGSGLTVNVSEKDTRFDMFVYIKML